MGFASRWIFVGGGGAICADVDVGCWADAGAGDAEARSWDSQA